MNISIILYLIANDNLHRSNIGTNHISSPGDKQNKLYTMSKYLPFRCVVCELQALE